MADHRIKQSGKWSQNKKTIRSYDRFENHRSCYKREEITFLGLGVKGKD